MISETALARFYIAVRALDALKDSPVFEPALAELQNSAKR